jgi:hypothetical protein
MLLGLECGLGLQGKSSAPFSCLLTGFASRAVFSTVNTRQWLLLVVGCPLAAGVLLLALMVLRPTRVKLQLMGLGASRMKHGMMQVDASVAFAETVAKGRLKDVWKSVQRVYRRSGIVARTREMRWPGAAHVRVLWQHERRYASSPLGAALLVVGRYLSFVLCCGESVDEYYAEEKLVAFSCAVAKGNCIRAMWYYSADEASKSCVFHFAIALSVWRALRLGLEWVDLGPSPRRLREAKEKMGFEFRNDYKPSYVGEFRDIPCVDNAFLEAKK